MNRTLTSAQKLVNTNSFFPTQTHRSGSGNGVSGVSQDYSKAKSLHKAKPSSAATSSASSYKSGSIVPTIASMLKRTGSAPVDHNNINSFSMNDPLPETLPRCSSPTSQRQNQTTSNLSLASLFPKDSLCKSKASSSGPLSNTTISNSGVLVSFVKPTFGTCQPSQDEHPASSPSCKPFQTATPFTHPFPQQRMGPIVVQPLPPIKGVQISVESMEHSVDFKQVLLLKDDKLSIVKVQSDEGKGSHASRPPRSPTRSTSLSQSRNPSCEHLACSEAGTAHSDYAARLDVSSPQAGWPQASQFLSLLLAQYAEQLSTLRGVPWQGVASADSNLLHLHHLQAWGSVQEKGFAARGRLTKLAGGKKNPAQPRLSPLALAQPKHQTDPSSTCLDRASSKAASLKADHKVERTTL